jgi:trehalose 6-phosphate phosphatase
MSSSAGGSSEKRSGLIRLKPQEFADLFMAQVDKHAPKSGTRQKVAFLLAFDIDETLKESAMTGSSNVVPSRVVKALATINGAFGNMFIAVATGRNPEDADNAFPGYEFATIAKDGRYIRDFDRNVTRHNMPSMPEFVTAVSRILNDNSLVGAERIDVDDALGVAIPKEYRNDHKRLTKEFERMAVDRRDKDIVIYTHEHSKLEIIVQHAWYTKGTGVKELREAIRKMRFEKVIVVTFGNSTNDESMHEIANKSGGFSVRISEGRTCAKYRFAAVRDLQEGLVLASNRIKQRGGHAPGLDTGDSGRSGGRDSSGKSRK